MLLMTKEARHMHRQQYNESTQKQTCIHTPPPTTHTHTHIRCLNQALCNSMWSQWKILWNLYFPASTRRNLSFQFNWEQQWFHNVAPWASSESPGETDWEMHIHRSPGTSLREAKDAQYEEDHEICPWKSFLVRFWYVFASTGIRLAELM